MYFFRFADKKATEWNQALVNTLDLNQILRFEIFAHKDDQLLENYIILSYTPSYTHFQAQKYMIKFRDPRLPWINILVDGLIT